MFSHFRRCPHGISLVFATRALRTLPLASAAVVLACILGFAVVRDSARAADQTPPSSTDAPERTLRIVAHQRVSLLGIRRGEEVPCDTLERCLGVSRYLLGQASEWLD